MVDQGNVEPQSRSRYLIIVLLVIAGEMIFVLPYHVIRYFRSTVLDVFDLSNADFGDAFALYGILAMLSYFPSGLMADRFSARKLMSFSLFATACGGLFMATIPNSNQLTLLFGYWGITTILLFWAALLRATREWGGKFSQGRAFGFLDGGRGLVGAGAASLAVFLLATWLPTGLENIPFEKRIMAVKAIIFFYTALTFITGILIWIYVPDSRFSNKMVVAGSGIRSVLKSRAAWLQAIIVVCAYCGYRGLDFYSLYAIDMLGMDELSAAQFVSNATFLRPVGAILAGVLADRFSTQKVIKSTLFILLGSYLVLIVARPMDNLLMLVIIDLLFTFLTVFALRGIYFALFEETNVKKSLTGTTIGLVSVVGFTPDIFFNSIAGRILDGSSGFLAYRDFYSFLGLFAVIGIFATFLLIRTTRD